MTSNSMETPWVRNPRLLVQRNARASRQNRDGPSIRTTGTTTPTLRKATTAAASTQGATWTTTTCTAATTITYPQFLECTHVAHRLAASYINRNTQHEQQPRQPQGPSNRLSPIHMLFTTIVLHRLVSIQLWLLWTPRRTFNATRVQHLFFLAKKRKKIRHFCCCCTICSTTLSQKCPGGARREATWLFLNETVSGAPT